MPEAPKKPCGHPGCPVLVKKGRCTKHAKQQRQRYDRERGSRIERGYTDAWIRYAKWYRQRNPLCVICHKSGKITPSQCVDHIIPVNGPGDPRFMDIENHQALCHSCHSRKTTTDDGGFGNER